jgi:hypothetical protein
MKTLMGILFRNLIILHHCACQRKSRAKFSCNMLSPKFSGVKNISRNNVRKKVGAGVLPRHDCFLQRYYSFP